MNSILKLITDFLFTIQLPFSYGNVEDNTFLPGLEIRHGELIIDIEKLLYPGDILHESGHLACMHPDLRSSMHQNLEINDLNTGGELMAIAWSYAACIHLKLPPEIVFHENGYKGDCESIIDNFREGRYIGVPLLEWHGMTYSDSKASAIGSKPFPEMITWVTNKPFN